MKQDKTQKDDSSKVIKQENENSDYENRIKELEEENAQLKNSYLRALADYKNLENRMNQVREQMKDTIKKQIIEELLPVIDNLDQAEIFTKDVGLLMISKAFRQTLERLGVHEVELKDTEYDPNFAEVIEAVPGEQDNIVLEVVQKAYELNGNLIRHGKVKVSKNL